VHDVTWGLDLSTSPRKTAAVALGWSTPGEAQVLEVRHPLTATDIVALIAAHRESSWAVDVPFGWPDDFVEVMAGRHTRPLRGDEIPAPAAWDDWRTHQIAQRRTDRFLTSHPRIGVRPLPAAFQLLGATAAMWVLVEAQLAQCGVAVDRAGVTGAICETYPRAAQVAWGLTGSKRTWPQLHEAFPFLRVEAGLLSAFAHDDVRDALVCALVGRARALGLTIGPPSIDLAAARREGWIHVSCEPASRLVATTS